MIEKEINVHGETCFSVFMIVDGFIYESYKLKLKIVAIVHGKSSNILKDKVHELLKKNKYVKEYMLDANNLGRTIIYLESNN